jgi:hypothetical protein
MEPPSLAPLELLVDEDVPPLAVDVGVPPPPLWPTSWECWHP